MTLINIDEIEHGLKGIGAGINKQEPGSLLRIHYTNYTHLMLGDYRGYHFRCITHDCKSPFPSKGLVAQAIRGKARWLARVTLASLEGCSSYDYRNVEKYCGEIVFKTKKKGGKEARIGLIELMFGSLDSIQMTSPFVLRAILDIQDNPYYWFDSCKHTRFHLITMGKSENNIEKKLLSTWKPNSLRITLNIGLAPHWFKLLEELKDGDIDAPGSLKLLPCFYGVLVTSVPLLLGIGKGSTRGFGRFRIEDKDLRELKNIPLAKICPNQWSRFTEAITQLHKAGNSYSIRYTETLRSLLRSILELASNVTGKSIENSLSLSMIPRLVYAAYKAEVVVAKNVRNIDDALCAIGGAVLKQKWKQAKKQGRGSGLGFHTWPLGLPRKSEIKCVCKDGGKSKDKHSYGYIVVPSNIFDPETNPNQCVKSKYCIDKKYIEKMDNNNQSYFIEDLIESLVPLVVRERGNIVQRIEQKAKDVRHSSMLILFPLPASPRLIALLPLPAYSLNLGIDNESPSVGNLILLHLGGHFYRDYEGKPRPCCNTHVVTISYAISVKKVKAPKFESTLEKDLCGCGEDPANVIKPLGEEESSKNSISNSFIDIVETAFNWVKYILEKGLWR